MAPHHSSRPLADGTGKSPFPPRRKTDARLLRRALFWPALLPIMLVSGLLLNWAFLIPTAFAAPAASSNASGPNTIQQFLQEGQQSKANQGAYHRLIAAPKTFAPLPSTQDSATGKRVPSAEPAKMK